MIYRYEKRLSYTIRHHIPPLSFPFSSIYEHDWKKYSLEQLSWEKYFCQTQDKVILKSVSVTRKVI